MRRALVDSNVLIAAVSRRDRHNETALDVVRAADRGELPVLEVPDYVVAETLNYVAGRGHRSAGLDLYDRLDESSGFELVETSRRDDHAAIERYRSSAVLSFVDAALAAYADRTGVEYCYSFDDDLDSLDVLARLDGPIDPYAPE